MNVKNTNGFSLVEMMVVLLILSIMIGGIYMSLAAGQNTFLNTNTQIQLSENLRLTMTKVSKELRESGEDAGNNLQVTINDGGGINNSDIVRFSIPVICEAGGSIIDAAGDVANWGAPLTWGCTDSTCMDLNDDCASVEYQFVEYRIDNTNQLLRRVLNPALATVRQDVFAQNITDFQVVLSGDQNVVTLTVTATQTTALNRLITTTDVLNVRLRNKG